MSIWDTMLRAPEQGASGYARGETASTMKMHADGTITVATHQDIDPILKRNRELRNEDGYTGDFQEHQDSWGRRVASIPIVLYNQWMHDKDFPKHPKERIAWILDKLDTKDYEDLKVVDEKVSRHKSRAYYRGSTAPPKISVVKDVPDV